MTGKTNIDSIVLSLIRERVGRDNAISNSDIRTFIQDSTGAKVLPSKIRKVISRLRTTGKGAEILSCPNGYYLVTSEEEYLEFIRRFENRVANLREIRNKMCSHFLDRYGKMVVRNLETGEVTAHYPEEIEPPMGMTMFKEDEWKLIMAQKRKPKK